MKLQIQTFRQTQNPASSIHVSLPPVSQIFPAPRISLPSQPLLSQLRQIQLTAKAHHHYLNSLRIKTFRCLYEEDYEAQISLMEKGFLAFKQNKVQKNYQNNFLKKIVQNLKSNLQKSQRKKNQLIKAKLHYERTLLKNIFSQVFSMITLRKKYEKLDYFIKNQLSFDFLYFLKETSRQSKNLKLKDQQADEQVSKIYQKSVFNKVFTSWKLYSKSIKLEKFLKYKALQKFILKLIEDKRETLKKLDIFKLSQELKIKRKIFECIKETKLQSQCKEWYLYRLQKFYFSKWLEYHALEQQQKQIQEANQVILQYFLEKKKTQQIFKLKLKYFQFWKSFSQIQKQQKRQNTLMKSFAELKEKQYLERKYFEIFKQNRKYERALRFFNKNTKIKVFEGLKKNQIIQKHKFQNVQKFIQKRTVGKYFQKIRTFNCRQNYKVTKFLLQKVWFNFTFRLATQYYEKKTKAENYHKIALKFKSILGLKKNVEVQRKSEFCAFYLNISLPLKRWNQRFRYRRLFFEREFYLKKRIFFEWKIISIRKVLSRKDSVTSQLGVESKIEVRKMGENQKESYVPKGVKKHTESVVSNQISFFKRLDQNSDEEDDQMTKKVDSLLTRIKSKRNEAKKELSELQNVSGFSNQRLMFANESIERKGAKETYEKLRLPTWSSPGEDYRVSVFSEESED